MHLGSVANCYLQMEGHEQQQQQQQNVTNGLIKIQIANHPLYPALLSAYIECQKVGAPPEMACLLEDIGRGSHIMNACPQIRERDGLELDHFMESYCEILHRYKEELSKPFNEATLFLGDMESQLSKLCKAKTLTKSSHNYSRTDDEVGGALEEESSCEEKEAAVEVHELSCSIHPGDEIEKLKEMLLRKYRGQFSSLRKEFQKKRKKGKLPKDARVALMNWWNTHHKWPYPTEEEKVKLVERTGLDQKQINNWFINQRKRHWKPTEDMRFAIMEGVSTSIGGPLPFQV